MGHGSYCDEVLGLRGLLFRAPDAPHVVESIVNGKWFKETLPESWKSEDTVHIQCKRMCGINE
jgi:hypothetical protein